jgi:predicted MFS family arabinose efflux permease
MDWRSKHARTQKVALLLRYTTTWHLQDMPVAVDHVSVFCFRVRVAMKEKLLRDLLRRPHYSNWYSVGIFLEYTAWNLATTAVSLLIWNTTRSSTGLVGGILTETIAATCFGVLSGSIVDVVRPWRSYIASQTTLALVSIACLVLLSFHDRYSVIVCYILAISSIATVSSAASFSLVSAIADSKVRNRLNSKNVLAIETAYVVGPAVCAILTRFQILNYFPLFVAATYALHILILLFVSKWNVFGDRDIILAEKANSDQRLKPTWQAALSVAWSVYPLLIASLLLSMITYPVYRFLPEIADRLLSDGQASPRLAVAVGVGSLVGSIGSLITIRNFKIRHNIKISSLVMIISIGMLVMSRSGVTPYFAFALFGVTWTSCYIRLQEMILARVPKTVSGKFWAIGNLAMKVGVVLGSLEFGFWSNVASLRTALLLVILVGVGFVAVCWLALERHVAIEVG